MHFIRLIPFLLFLDSCNSVRFFNEEDQFFPERVDSVAMCAKFFNQPTFKFARSDIYGGARKWYLDPALTISMESCLNKTNESMDKKLLITEFRNINYILSLAWESYIQLRNSKPNVAILVPMFSVVMGPGGRLNDLYKKRDVFVTNILAILAPAEEENITAKYPKDFKKKLDKKLLVFNNGQENTWLVQLNAWHLYNTNTIFDWDGFKMFMGIILHASPKYADLLSHKQLRSRIPLRFQDRLFMDFPGDMQRISTSEGKIPFQLPFSTFLVIVVITLLIQVN